MSRKIFTYYSAVPGVSQIDSTKLILLWRQNWLDLGFEPIVLNESHARQHPLFENYQVRVGKFPSVNPAGYDQACWLRWLAMVQVGGGIMADYDLFGFDAKVLHRRGNKYRTCLMFQKHVPSLVMGDEFAFTKIVEGFMNYELSKKDIENGIPHLSDMHALLRGNIQYDPGNYLVRNFGEEGWDKSPFVHFSTGAMRGGHLPKWKHIRELRNWK